MIPRRLQSSQEHNQVRAALIAVVDKLFALLYVCCDDGPFSHLTVARDRIGKAIAGPIQVDAKEMEAKLEEWRRG
jgi:hypothetical protein